jgi:hypothetical protein
LILYLEGFLLLFLCIVFAVIRIIILFIIIFATFTQNLGFQPPVCFLMFFPFRIILEDIQPISDVDVII